MLTEGDNSQWGVGHDEAFPVLHAKDLKGGYRSGSPKATVWRRNGEMLAEDHEGTQISVTAAEQLVDEKIPDDLLRKYEEALNGAI